MTLMGFRVAFTGEQSERGTKGKGTAAPMIYSGNSTAGGQHLPPRTPKQPLKLKRIKSFVHVYGKGWLL